jgi:hypothetical protein
MRPDRALPQHRARRAPAKQALASIPCTRPGSLPPSACLPAVSWPVRPCPGPATHLSLAYSAEGAMQLLVKFTRDASFLTYAAADDSQCGAALGGRTCTDTLSLELCAANNACESRFHRQTES